MLDRGLLVKENLYVYTRKRLYFDTKLLYGENAKCKTGKALCGF